MQLRPMTMADADKMLEWKNYPETRQFSIVSHEEIKKEDHYKYLKENLQYFQIIEGHFSPVYHKAENGLATPELWPCGALRIQNNEISIWVDKFRQGMGIASFVLEEVSEKGMTAKIVEGNIASMRAFINAGFKPVSYIQSEVIYKMGASIQKGYYIFKK